MEHLDIPSSIFTGKGRQTDQPYEGLWPTLVACGHVRTESRNCCRASGICQQYPKVGTEKHELTLGPRGPSRTAQTEVPHTRQCEHLHVLRS